MKLLRYFLTIVCLSASFKGACAYDIDKLKQAVPDVWKHMIGRLDEEKLELQDKSPLQFFKSLQISEGIGIGFKKFAVDSMLRFMSYCYVDGDQNNNNIKKTKKIFEILKKYYTPWIVTRWGASHEEGEKLKHERMLKRYPLLKENIILMHKGTVKNRALL
ncbi:MAG: hypothetical protein WC707_03945 [Candidatus Babeliaceae bacterium]|jgi:hypothetical protein